MPHLEVDADALSANDVPGGVVDVLDHFHGIHYPEDAPPPYMEVVQRGVNGRCMLCSARLGAETHVIVNVLGVTEIYCGVKCHQDMQLKGWIEQEYDDMLDRIRFRGEGSPEGGEE